MPLQAGDVAPEVSGANAPDGGRVLFFYKVTCPTCQMAAAPAERLHRALGDRFVAVGQDPPERLDAFAREYDVTWDAVSESPPYPVSDAYGIRSVPTVFLVAGGRVVETVESWNRDAWNALAVRAGEVLGTKVEEVSSTGDGLPPFRPG